MFIGTSGSDPVEELSWAKFSTIIGARSVRLAEHALKRLSERQRTEYSAHELLRKVKSENPVALYRQRNRRYAAFFKDKGFDKPIIEIENGTATIVTFMHYQHLPRYRT